MTKKANIKIHHKDFNDKENNEIINEKIFVTSNENKINFATSSPNLESKKVFNSIVFKDDNSLEILRENSIIFLVKDKIIKNLYEFSSGQIVYYTKLVKFKKDNSNIHINYQVLDNDSSKKENIVNDIKINIAYNKAKKNV